MKNNQTIAQFLGITTFPYSINNEQGKVIYFEDSIAFWEKREYDSNGNETRYEDSTGYWEKLEYNANGKQTRYETSEGYWEKYEYNAKGKRIYYESSYRIIRDDRPKQTELTLAEIASKLNIPLEQLRIKD